jgi:hypothetical protein
LKVQKPLPGLATIPGFPGPLTACSTWMLACLSALLNTVIFSLFGATHDSVFEYGSPYA